MGYYRLLLKKIYLFFLMYLRQIFEHFRLSRHSTLDTIFQQLQRNQKQASSLCSRSSVQLVVKYQLLQMNMFDKIRKSIPTLGLKEQSTGDYITTKRCYT